MPSATQRLAKLPDIVAFRCDFPAWLETLSRRDHRIAEILAIGHSTLAVAKRFGVSPGRVSQLRRELHDSWKEFTAEADVATTAASDYSQPVQPER